MILIRCEDPKSNDIIFIRTKDVKLIRCCGWRYPDEYEEPMYYVVETYTGERYMCQLEDPNWQFNLPNVEENLLAAIVEL